MSIYDELEQAEAEAWERAGYSSLAEIEQSFGTQQLEGPLKTVRKARKGPIESVCVGYSTMALAGPARIAESLGYMAKKCPEGHAGSLVWREQKAHGDNLAGFLWAPDVPVCDRDDRAWEYSLPTPGKLTAKHLRIAGPTTVGPVPDWAKRLTMLVCDGERVPYPKISWRKKAEKPTRLGATNGLGVIIYAESVKKHTIPEKTILIHELAHWTTGEMDESPAHEETAVRLLKAYGARIRVRSASQAS